MQEKRMGFSLWHWLIVTAISAFLFRHQIMRVIHFFADPGRALKESMGIHKPKDRQPIGKQSRVQMSVWLIGLAALFLIFVWKTSSYWTGRPWP
jgi:hypothetical protein